MNDIIYKSGDLFRSSTKMFGKYESYILYNNFDFFKDDCDYSKPDIHINKNTILIFIKLKSDIQYSKQAAIFLVIGQNNFIWAFLKEVEPL